MRVLIIVCASLALTGCVTAEQAALQQQTIAAAESYCRETTKTHFQRAQCFNSREASFFPGNPMLAARAAKRLEIAVKVDKGTLSEQEGEAEWATATAQWQLQAAAQQQAAAADFGNRMERAGGYLQSINPGPPRGVTCMTIGPGMVQCN
jgi:hypothetical protein